MTDSPALRFFNAVAGGRLNTAQEWHEYLEAFHADLPHANELFTLLRRFSGETSYAMLAKAAIATGALRFLDAGCGDGNLEDELVRLLPEKASVVGVDMSAAEIKISRARFAGDARLRFEVADLRALPFEDASFECALAHQSLNLFPEIAPVLSEVRRVLRPGGRLVFVANRGWRTDQTANWMLLNQAAMLVLKKRHPDFVWPLMGDMRIYNEPGIAEIFSEAPGWNARSLSIETFNTSASMTPKQIAAIYNRLYLFATVPDRKPILDAVERRAKELSVDGLFQIDLPFRLISVDAA